MVMQDDQRRAYQQAAGLTDEQLRQTIGGFTVEQVSARASGLAAAALTSAQQGVRRLVMDAVIISAKYNEVARRSKQDARSVTAQAEIATDRALLENLIGDEYRMANPFGKVENKQRTINKILSGTIRPDTFGRGGFETTEETFHIHGNTATYAGTFDMHGMGLAQFTKSNAVRARNLTGSYRTTHTFVFRDGRWQITASHMTQVPATEDFVFVGEGDTAQ